MAEEVIKPQSPIKSGSIGILPLTSYDQIIMADGTRWNGVVVPEGALDPANIPIIDTTGEEADTLIPINAQQLDGMTYRQIIDLEHGIGSFYFTLNAADDPNTKWNWMTWELVTDKFLLGAGNTYEGGTEGGEAEHTLTIDEMPNHDHNVIKSHEYDRLVLMAQAQNLYAGAGNATGSGDWKWNKGVPAQGGSQPHNNMPPYLSVFMWTRIS